MKRLCCFLVVLFIAVLVNAQTAKIVLSVPEVIWETNPGYQLLLDSTASESDAYMTVGFLGECGMSYENWSHTIPFDADGSNNHVVALTSDSIVIPAGIYDYLVVSPNCEANTVIGIATDQQDPARGNNYNFEAGKKYTFTMSKRFNPIYYSETDCVTITIEDDLLETQSYNISGTVVDTENNPIEGVTIAYNGGTVTTEANGSYNFTAEENTSHTITATKEGYTFAPSDTTINVVTSDITNVNFVGTLEGGQVAIDENTINNFSIYPNPARQELQIEVDNFQNIEIVNILGNSILTTKSNIIDITMLSNGIYIIQVKFQNGELISKKFIKE